MRSKVIISKSLHQLVSSHNNIIWHDSVSSLLSLHTLHSELNLMTIFEGDPSGSPSKNGMAVISDRNYNV